VGSDLDLLIIVENSERTFERRGSEWDVEKLPVPSDVLVYTRDEWESLIKQGHFYSRIMNEIVWVYVSDAESGKRSLKS